MGGEPLSTVDASVGRAIAASRPGPSGDPGAAAVARANAEAQAPTATDTDEALAGRSADGDRAAFGLLVKRYEGRVYRFALSRLRRADDAADVAQETLCRAWRGIGRFDTGRSFSAWVMAIARREIVEVVRRDARAKRDARREDERRASRVEEQSAGESAGVWETARRVLDDRAFELVWLRYAEDLTPGEIARVVGSTGVSVRVSLHRARKRLETALSESGGAVPGRANDA